MASQEPTQLENLSVASFLARLDWKEIARYKHSSLFGPVVTNEEKKFYDIDTRPVKILRIPCHHPEAETLYTRVSRGHPFAWWGLGLYSLHFIFFVTYEFVQQARVFLPGEAFHSSVT